MGFMDKIKGKLSSSSSSGSGENKRASFAGSSPQAAAAAPSSTQNPAAANPATSATAAAPAAAPAATTTTAAAAATTAPATTAPATTAPATATTTTPATAASNPATTAGNDTSYQPEPATEANKSTGATPTTSSTNMTSYTGTCHCKHHEWTVELTPDQSKHILWYVYPFFFLQTIPIFSFSFFAFFLPQLSSAQLTFRSHCDTCKILGGGAYTLNQIIPKSALKITKGGEPGKYTYYGDSGKVPFPPHQSLPSLNHPPPSFLTPPLFGEYRQSTATSAPNVPLTSTIIKKSWARKPLLLERHFCEMHERHLGLGRKFMGRRKWPGNRGLRRLLRRCRLRERGEM